MDMQRVWNLHSNVFRLDAKRNQRATPRYPRTPTPSCKKKYLSAANSPEQHMVTPASRYGFGYATDFWWNFKNFPLSGKMTDIKLICKRTTWRTEGRSGVKGTGREWEREGARKGARRIVRLAAKIKIPCTLEHFIWRLNCMAQSEGGKGAQGGQAERRKERERGREWKGGSLGSGWGHRWGLWELAKMEFRFFFYFFLLCLWRRLNNALAGVCVRRSVCVCACVWVCRGIY